MNDIFKVVALNTVVPTMEETIADKIMEATGTDSVRSAIRRRYEVGDVQVALENMDDVMRALYLETLVEPKGEYQWQITDTGRKFYPFIRSGVVGWGSQAGAEDRDISSPQ